MHGRGHDLQPGAREGKIELTAARPGLFRVDSRRLMAVNAIEELMIATRHGNTPVQAGDKLCGTRVIPLVIQESRLEAAERAMEGRPLLELLPYTLKTAAIITTGSEVCHGRVEDKFTPVLVEKLAAYGIEVLHHALVDDGTEPHCRCHCRGQGAKAGHDPLYGRHERGSG